MQKTLVFLVRLLALMAIAAEAVSCAPGSLSPTALSPSNTAVVSPTDTGLPAATSELPSVTPIPPTATAVPPSVTPIPPTATAVSPSPTPLPPSATSLPSTATLEPSSTPAVETTIEIFLIALEDNGRSGKAIGCGDSVVPVQIVVPHTLGVLRAALEALLAVKEQYYGQSGLYNALYQSDLQLESVAIEGGTAVIHLSGSLVLGGECDNPRVEAQLVETALQFATVKETAIFVNGTPLEELLSLKG